MKNLKTIQTISKVLYILTKIAFICCIVGTSAFGLGIISVASLKDNPEFLQMVAEMGEPFNFNIWLCTCICGLVECGFGIAIYYLVQKFYKFELACGDPFKVEVADKMKTLGIVRLILPLACSFVLGIITGAFGVEFSFISGFGITMGFVYLVVSVLIRYHLDLEQKHIAELVKGDIELVSDEKTDNKENI